MAQFPDDPPFNFTHFSVKLSDFKDGTLLVRLEERQLEDLPLCPANGTELLPQLNFSKWSMITLKDLTSLHKRLTLYICLD